MVRTQLADRRPGGPWSLWGQNPKVESRAPDRDALSVPRASGSCGHSSCPQYIVVLCQLLQQSSFNAGQNSSTMLSSLIPITYLTCASTCFYVALNVGFRLRWLCMPFLFFFAGLSVLGSHHLAWPQGLPDLWSLSVVMWTIHVISLLFCEDHLEVLKRTDIQATSESTTRWQLRPAYKLLFNVRLLQCERRGTEDCVNDREPQPRNGYQFFTIKLLRLLVLWLLHTRIEPLIYPKPFLPFTSIDFSPTRQRFFRRLLLSTGPSVTLRETCIRACLAVRWIWIAIYEIEAAHACLAILFVVVLRLDTEREWPPLFGNATEAYSLRNFWGRFWHRIADRSYTNLGCFVSRRVIGFKASTTTDKITRIFVVFLISGLAHSLVSWCSGDKRHYMLDTSFFILNFLGGGLEVVFSKVSALTLGTSSWDKTKASLSSRRWIALKQTFGYCCVFCFFFCVVPKWQYPRAYEQLRYVERMKGLLSMLSAGSG
jgi:hypothetical protein